MENKDSMRRHIDNLNDERAALTKALNSKNEQVAQLLKLNSELCGLIVDMDRNYAEAFKQLREENRKLSEAENG